MRSRVTNRETAGTCLAKTGKGGDLQDARPDDSIEDLLDGPLPAG